MHADKTHVIVYHGTCSAFASSLFSNGFILDPPCRPSASGEGHDHLAAFSGTYVATERNTARYYADMATRLYGGEPRVAVLRVPVAAMVPDEDEVHYALAYPLAVALGFQDNDEDEQVATKAWGLEAAKDTLRMVKECFGLDEQAINDAATHLNAMIAASLGPDWDGDLWFFHPEGNEEGWSSPNWVRRLCKMEGGLAVYRQNMAALLNTMRGPPPENYPAGFESFKGRIVMPFGFGVNDCGISIVGFGTLDDPFSIHSNFGEFVGDELSLDPDFVQAAKTRLMPLRAFG